jgi:hypothetical protein
LLAVSPAVQVRRTRLHDESHAIAFDRNEIGALLARRARAAIDRSLVSVLALNGLRVAKATGADIEALALQRRHRRSAQLRALSSA